MITLTFDTHDFVVRLKAAGFDQQVECVLRLLVDAQSGLVTREYFDARIGLLEARFEAKFDKLSWMLGIIVALAVANFAKAFL